MQKEVTESFQNMMEDLMFGKNGFFKELPEEQKAAGLEVINNTTLSIIGTGTNDLFQKDEKVYQLFKLSSEGKKVFAKMGRKWIEFFGTEDQGMKIWEKLRIKIDLYKELDIYLNINLVESVHYFDTLEDMKAFINEELL